MIKIIPSNAKTEWDGGLCSKVLITGCSASTEGIGAISACSGAIGFGPPNAEDVVLDIIYSVSK